MKKLFKRNDAITIYVVIYIFFCIYGCSHVLQYSGQTSDDHSLVKEIVGQINKIRSKGTTCGNKYYKPVKPVIWNNKLGQAALQHSLDMAKKGFLSHTGSDGSNPEERLSKVGYRWSSYGENIGQGFRTPDEAVKSWLKSEMHCKKIMNPDFKEAGTAFVKSSNRRSYWTLILGNSRQ